MSVEQELVEQIPHEPKCPHCSHTGTCSVDDGKSCGTCLKAAKVKNTHKVVQCRVCGGTGSLTRSETQFSERSNTIGPLIVLGLVLAVFYVGSFKMLDTDNAAQVYTAIVSLTSVIVTFYFGKKDG